MKGLLSIVLFLIAGDGFAQNKTHAPKAKHQSAIVKKKPVPVTLNNTGTYTAKAYDVSAARRLQISDTIVATMKAKAQGAQVDFDGRKMIGVPRGTYGFANGRLLLYSNASTSSGTATGSGSVGTGSSPASVGSFGPTTGTNGKSPYAGSGPYATRLPVLTNSIDTSKIKRP
jgi:hypothetical protein